MAAIAVLRSWHDGHTEFRTSPSMHIAWSEEDTRIRLGQIAQAWVSLREARYDEASRLQKVWLTISFLLSSARDDRQLMQQRAEP